jgi:peptidoglycan hydrolase CwlO-like protein
LEQQGSEHDQHIGKLVKKVCALDDRVDWIHSKIHKHNKYLQQHKEHIEQHKEHIEQHTQDMR